MLERISESRNLDNGEVFLFIQVRRAYEEQTMIRAVKYNELCCR